MSAAEKEMLMRRLQQEAPSASGATPSASAQPVSAKPIKSSIAVAKQRKINWRMLPVVAVGLVFFGYLWVFGAKYTIDGIPYVINFLLSFLNAPFKVGTNMNIYWYAGLSWIPILWSYNEWSNPPIYRENNIWKVASFWAIIVWLLVAATDFVSTLAGVQHPSADSWLLSKQIAGSIIAAGIWTGILTFGPEAGARAMLRLATKEVE